MSLLRKLIDDDAGFIVSTELVLIGTVLVFGSIVGMTCLRDAVIGEFDDVANSIGSLNQSYSYAGMSGCFDCLCGVHSYTRGSVFVDVDDAGDVEREHYEVERNVERRIERRPVVPEHRHPAPRVQPAPQVVPVPAECPPVLPPLPAALLPEHVVPSAAPPCETGDLALPCPCVNPCRDCLSKPQWVWPVPPPIVW